MDNNSKEKLIKKIAIYGACLLIGFIMLAVSIFKCGGDIFLSVSNFIDVLPGLLIFVGGLVGVVQSVIELTK